MGSGICGGRERGDFEGIEGLVFARAYGFNPQGELVGRQESPEGSELKAIRVVVEAVKGKEYARKVFDRPPACKRALKTSKVGDSR